MILACCVRKVREDREHAEHRQLVFLMAPRMGLREEADVYKRST